MRQEKESTHEVYYIYERKPDTYIYIYTRMTTVTIFESCIGLDFDTFQPTVKVCHTHAP